MNNDKTKQSPLRNLAYIYIFCSGKSEWPQIFYVCYSDIFPVGLPLGRPTTPGIPSPREAQKPTTALQHSRVEGTMAFPVSFLDGVRAWERGWSGDLEGGEHGGEDRRGGKKEKACRPQPLTQFV